jgi:energy-coupling factor transporter ATP-binding protein EcfA2
MININSKQLSFWVSNSLSKQSVLLFSGKAGTGKSTSTKLAEEIIFNKYKIKAVRENFKLAKLELKKKK